MVLGLSTAICGGVGVATGGVVADLMKRHIREDAHTFHGPHIGHPHDHCGTFRAQRRNPARGLYCQRVSAVCQCSVDWCGRRHHYHPGPPQNARHGFCLLSGNGHFFRARYGALHHRLSQRHVSSVGNTPADSLGLSLKLALLVYVIVAIFTVLLFRHYREDFNTREARAIAAGEPAHPKTDHRPARPVTLQSVYPRYARAVGLFSNCEIILSSVLAAQKAARLSERVAAVANQRRIGDPIAIARDRRSRNGQFYLNKRVGLQSRCSYTNQTNRRARNAETASSVASCPRWKKTGFRRPR